MQFTDPKGNKFASLSEPIWRASTVLFDNFEDFVNRKSRQPDGYSYGMTGTPTNRALERRIAALEGANHCIVLPSGQAALMLPAFAFLEQGDHLLISESCYGALKTIGSKYLTKLGVEVEMYPPLIGGDIEKLIKPKTKLICMESPGTITMEMQDVDAIVAIARAHGIRTMIDNTWASPLFYRPIEHGVDIVVESVTKMLGGHSDLLMGALSLNNFEDYCVLRESQSVFGLNTSQSDIFLVLRAMESLEVRMIRQDQSTCKVARWLAEQPQVSEVFFPALPGDPGYELWKKNYKGAGPLFSFTFKEKGSHNVGAFFDHLKMFPLGASWGGTHSLVAYYPAAQQHARKFTPTRQAIVRVAIGLEDPDELIADLKGALEAWESS